MGDPSITVESLGGRPPDGNDDRWLTPPNLFYEISRTLLDVLDLRLDETLLVPTREASNGVRHPPGQICPLKDLTYYLIEKSTRLTHEGLANPILLGPRSLSDEEDVRVHGTPPLDTPRTCPLVKRTASAFGITENPEVRVGLAGH